MFARLGKVKTELSRRLSRSMESVDSIVRNLQEFEEIREQATVRRVASTNNLNKECLIILYEMNFV